MAHAEKSDHPVSRDAEFEASIAARRGEILRAVRQLRDDRGSSDRLGQFGVTSAHAW